MKNFKKQNVEKHVRTSELRGSALFPIFALLYIMASFFIMVLHLPLVGYKVQAAEFVFPFLGLAGWLRFGKHLLPARITSLEVLLLAYFSCNLLSAIAAGTTAAWLESLGRGYLILVFYCFYALASHEGRRAQKIVPLAFVAGALISAIAGVAGWGLALSGLPNFAVRLYADYPYLGTLYRVNAFTPGMTMLLSLLFFPILYTWRRLLLNDWISGIKTLLIFGLLLFCALLTFSKTLLLLGLALFLTWRLLKRGLSPGWSLSCTMLTALIFWMGTHFLFVEGKWAAEHLQKTHYASDEVFLLSEDIAVLPTSYAALKKAAWLTGLRHPLIGVGPGAFNEQLPRLKAEGHYPDHLPDYDPHSTWLGAFAEIGVSGLLLTAFIWIYLLRLFWIHRAVVLVHPVLFPISIFLTATLIESVALDIMNFRHLWVLLGASCGWLSTSSQVASN